MRSESPRFAFPDRDCHTPEPEFGQELKCPPKPRKRKLSFSSLSDNVLSPTVKRKLDVDGDTKPPKSSQVRLGCKPYQYPHHDDSSGSSCPIAVCS